MKITKTKSDITYTLELTEKEMASLTHACSQVDLNDLECEINCMGKKMLGKYEFMTFRNTISDIQW